ncbi:hypothetical protein BaRGS_00033807, partial [Batillaria attramentaria]
MAIPLFLLVFVGSAVLFQPSLGFEWKSSSPDDGADITACIGENVTFPWEYTVGEDEVVLSTEWHKITDKETFLAAHTSGAFLKSPHLKMNVQFLPDAGIQISNYTWADFATYRVTVKYTLKNVLNSASRSVILAMPDVPVIAGDRLVAHVQPEPVLDRDTGVRHVQLTCGQFLSLGSMGPESVVWRVDEAKARLMLLEGGVEILQDKDVETDSELKRQKEVDSSLQDELSEQNATDNQLMSDVLRLEEKMSLQEETDSNHTSDIANLKGRLKTDIEGVQEELQEQQKTDHSLKFNISVVADELEAQNATDNQLMSDVLRLEEKTSLQEETDSNHTSDIANLNKKLKTDIEDVQEELQEQQKTDNHLKFNISVVEHKLAAQNATDNQLMSDVLRLEEKMSLQEETDSNHTSDIANLKGRLKTDIEGVQEELQEQQKTDNSLKFNISAVENELYEQKATDNQLMSDVLRLEGKMSLQEETDNNHTSDISTLNKRMKTDVEGLQGALKEQQKTDNHLKFNISVVEHKLAAQNATDNQLMSEVLHLKEGMSLQEIADNKHASDIANLKSQMLLAEKTDETILSNVNSLQEILLLQEKTDETLSSDVDDIQEILAQEEKADQAMSSNMAELHKDLMKEKAIREELSSELDQLRSRLRETEQNLQSTFLELAANVTLDLKTLLKQAKLKRTADIQEPMQQTTEQTDCTVRVGARVRRGPDWMSKNQVNSTVCIFRHRIHVFLSLPPMIILDDTVVIPVHLNALANSYFPSNSADGNPPGPGTVIRPFGTAGWWTVKWDAGRQTIYRMGAQGKYELEDACANFERNVGGEMLTNDMSGLLINVELSLHISREFGEWSQASPDTQSKFSSFSSDSSPIIQTETFARFINISNAQNHINISNAQNHINISNAQNHINISNAQNHINISNAQNHINGDFIDHTLAFTWTDTVPEQVSVCVGKPAVFSWNFAVDRETESVLSITWFGVVNGRTQDLVHARTGEFDFGIKAVPMQVAALKLKSAAPSDAGTYIVNVTYMTNTESGQQYLTASRSAELIVWTLWKAPSTTDDELHAVLEAVKIQTGKTSEWRVRLSCGTFLGLGHPSVSVVWKTPSDKTLPSTSYDRGAFYLDIDRTEAGLYSCQIDPKAPALICLDPNSFLLSNVDVHVNQVGVRFLVLEADSAEQKADLAEQKTQLAEQKTQLAEQEASISELRKQLNQ